MNLKMPSTKVGHFVLVSMCQNIEKKTTPGSTRAYCGLHQISPWSQRLTQANVMTVQHWFR